MNKIEYIKGDATSPDLDGNKIIAHICNDIGAWGKGFVLAISKKWKSPEDEYKKWHKSRKNFELGEVQFVKLEEDLWIANIIGQRDIVNDDDSNPPIRYYAVEKGLIKLSEFALDNNASVHMPRIGCGLAGGKWEKIEPIIEETLIKKNIKVIVYDFC